MLEIIDEYGFLRSKDGSRGDSCWQTFWHHSATCVAGAKDAALYSEICKNLDADPVKSAELALKSFCDWCITSEGFETHPEGANEFTRDQLSPLLLKGAVVHKFQPHLRGLYYPIIHHLVDLDQEGRPLSDHKTGAGLNLSIRYIIGLLANAYGVPYSKGKSSRYFWTALAAYQKMWNNQNFFDPKDIPRPYTIWNNIGLFTAAWLLDHDAVKGWRSLFTYYADNGWGLAYKIVAGKGYDFAVNEYYKERKTKSTEIMQQRGAGHRNLPEGDNPCLDWQINHALRLLYG